MYNIFTYEKSKLSEEQKERDLLKRAKSQDKIKAYREKLFENYSKRITEFILHMDKKPIKIKSYQSPIENTGRVSDPLKFKGKPQITIREYKTHRERLLVVLN
jgi:hypothetical protein